VGGQRHAPAASAPGKTRYPLYRRLGRPQGRAGRVRKISSPPGFDPRTVQPVGSRYTDCAFPAHTDNAITIIIIYTNNMCIKHIFCVPYFHVYSLKDEWQTDTFMRPSPYRAVNSFHLCYKNQSVYAVSDTSRCLF
jgi:hypothetical protein